MEEKKYNIAKILRRGILPMTLYSDVFGEVFLKKVTPDGYIFIEPMKGTGTGTHVLNPDGSMIEGERCIIFPTKENRDWTKYMLLRYEHVMDSLITKFGKLFKGFDRDTIYTTAETKFTSAHENQVKKLIALQKLMNVQTYIENGWIPDWKNKDEDKYSFYIKDGNGIVSVGIDNEYCSGNVYFSSEENARTAVDILGVDVIRQALSTDFI